MSKAKRQKHKERRAAKPKEVKRAPRNPALEITQLQKFLGDQLIPALNQTTHNATMSSLRISSIEELLIAKGVITKDEMTSMAKTVCETLGIPTKPKEGESASNNDGDVSDGPAQASDDDPGNGADQPLPDEGGDFLQAASMATDKK